jgi:hypothetical protein
MNTNVAVLLGKLAVTNGSEQSAANDLRLLWSLEILDGKRVGIGKTESLCILELAFAHLRMFGFNCSAKKTSMYRR